MIPGINVKAALVGAAKATSRDESGSSHASNTQYDERNESVRQHGRTSSVRAAYLEEGGVSRSQRAHRGFIEGCGVHCPTVQVLYGIGAKYCR
jgi:hypothetical protein